MFVPGKTLARTFCKDSNMQGRSVRLTPYSHANKVRQWSYRPAKVKTGLHGCLGLVVGLAVAALAAPAAVLAQTAAQSPTQSPETIEQAHISPTLYFTGAAAELRDRQTLHAQVPALVQQVGACQAASLIKEMDKAWAAMSRLQRHAAYLKIQNLENTQEQALKDAYQGVATDQSLVETAIDARLQQVPAEQIASLESYAYLARDMRAHIRHMLAPDAEAYRESVTLPHEDSIADAYDRLIDSIPKVKDVASPDTAKRRDAIQQRNQAYDAAAPVTATLLATLIDTENRDAVAQHYANAAERKYDSLGLSAKVINGTLAAVAAQSGAYRQYQQMIAQHAARGLGVASILSSEQDLAAGQAPPIPLAQGRQLILEALAPLGPDYTRRFAQLLDPANGRLDLAGGMHRAHTGTSIDAYDGPTALYYSGYDGSLKNLSTIAHEGGHAIHRELMNTAGLPIYEREGPHFLFEGYAIFNELLLLDHAAKIAKTPAHKEYALERLLAKISLELYSSAEETTLERNLYTAASGNALLDRAQIDRIYQDSIRPYESWPMSDVGVSRGWMRKSLLFEDPLYLVNYLYAAFVAVALYDKAESDPNFAAEYETLLRRGFDADPQTLLLSIGIRLDDPDLAKQAASLFEAKTHQLQRLYASDAP
jgi:oligoendopeptidase F